MVHPDDMNRVVTLFARACKGDTNHFEFKTSGTSERVFQSCFVPVRNSEYEVVRLIAMTEDITERKLAAEKILKLATHDTLTGLPNRHLLMDRLEKAIQISARAGEICSVLFVDLDRFKPVNDTYGHQIGDMLLRQVAERLETIIRSQDTVARF
jgi:PleD family two-component response regulator